jgi:hypothetical protein
MLKFYLIPAAVIIMINAVIYIARKRKNKNTMAQSRITVTGIAKNKDGFARVVVDIADSYCIDGMDLWQTEWLNKKIKVVGDLEIREIKSHSKIYTDKIKFIKSAVVYLTKK